MLPDVGIFITTFCKKKTRPTRDTRIQLYFSTSFSLLQHKMPCVHRFSWSWSVRVHMDQTPGKDEGRLMVGTVNGATPLPWWNQNTTPHSRGERASKGQHCATQQRSPPPRTCHPLGWTVMFRIPKCVCGACDLVQKDTRGRNLHEKRQAKSETESSRPRWCLYRVVVYTRLGTRYLCKSAIKKHNFMYNTDRG